MYLIIVRRTYNNSRVQVLCISGRFEVAAEVVEDAARARRGEGEQGAHRPERGLAHRVRQRAARCQVAAHELMLLLMPAPRLMLLAQVQVVVRPMRP